MRLLRIIVFWLFIAVSILFAASQVYTFYYDENTPPVIESSVEELEISIHDPQSSLLLGLTATDAQDGDISTDIIIESISRFIETGVSVVTYSIQDSDNNVTKYKRNAIYTDYTSPRFYLTKELRFNVGETVSLSGILHATDVLDGDISNKIRMLDSTINTTTAGTYRIDIQVTNSRGDYSVLSLPVIVEQTPYEALPVIELTDYLVYVSVGDRINLSSYVKAVYESDEEKTPISLSSVTAKSTLSSSSPISEKGLYQVKYAVSDDEGNERQSVILHIIAE